MEKKHATTILYTLLFIESGITDHILVLQALDIFFNFNLTYNQIEGHHKQITPFYIQLLLQLISYTYRSNIQNYQPTSTLPSYPHHQGLLISITS
jgi:hypothetical protein